MCCIITVLPALGRGDDQAALALADRRDDVDDAAGDVLFALDVALERICSLGAAASGSRTGSCACWLRRLAVDLSTLTSAK
jgi:hypothetical protein